MDPISIVSIVAKATETCLLTIKTLYDLREKYKDASVVIVGICSESTVISASLAQIQGLLLQRQDLTEVWKSRTQLPVVLDQALTGIMVVFSCLDAEIQRITAGTSDPGRLRWRPRLRMLWSESRLNDLLGSIRGQQTAVTLLIQVLQMNTLSDIKDMLKEKKDVFRAAATITQSLRVRNPSVTVANSIYHQADNANSAVGPDVTSVVAPSELEFEFDDMIINSQAYRRAMAHAQAKVTPPGSQRDPAIGDLIDLTDDLTIHQGDTAPAALPSALQDLQDLMAYRPSTPDQTTEGCADEQRVVPAGKSPAASSLDEDILKAVEFFDAVAEQPQSGAEPNRGSKTEFGTILGADQPLGPDHPITLYLLSERERLRGGKAQGSGTPPSRTSSPSSMIANAGRDGHTTPPAPHLPRTRWPFFQTDEEMAAEFPPIFYPGNSGVLQLDLSDCLLRPEYG